MITREEKQKGSFICDQDRLITSISKTFKKGMTKSYETPAGPGTTLTTPENNKVILSDIEQQEYRSGVGKLLYLSKMTRPDISNAT